MEKCQTCNKRILHSSAFCPHCGAQQVRERLTVWMLVQNLYSKVVNFDFTFFRTTYWLLTQPERVTLGYIQGVRKIFNPPIQYALIILSLYGLFQYFFADFLDQIGLETSFNNYDGSPEEQERNKKIAPVIQWLRSRSQFLTFSIIPFMGLLSTLFYRKNKLNLAEHLVISIYAISFTLLPVVLAGVLLAPFHSPLALDIYVNLTVISTFVGFSWIYYRSLKGFILNPTIIFIISFLILTAILRIGLLIFFGH
ncbi:MAG: DUF3667 domain-containing protein [Bacteroidota bacterium]